MESNTKEVIFVAESSLNDLSCREELCYDEVVSDVYGSCTSSELEFSDYTPSIFFDSGSEFSDKSESDESVTSNTFHLLIEFRRLFVRSSSSLDYSTKHLFVPLENSAVSCVLI